MKPGEREAEYIASTDTQNIISAVERYAGISMKPLQGWIDAVLSWWKITKPADSAKSLGDTLNEKNNFKRSYQNG